MWRTIGAHGSRRLPPVQTPMKTQKSRLSRNWKRRSSSPEPRLDFFAPWTITSLSDRGCAITLSKRKLKRGETLSAKRKEKEISLEKASTIWKTLSMIIRSCRVFSRKWAKSVKYKNLRNYNGDYLRWDNIDESLKNRRFPFCKAKMEMYHTWERKEILGGRKNLVWQIDRVDEKETWLVGAQQVLNLLNYAR